MEPGSVQSRSREDLLDRLREQRDFLNASSAAFDAGHEAEAIRLATTLRVLLHDTAKSHSLLRQLQLKHRIRLVTSSPVMPRGQSLWLGLVVIKLTPEWIEYSPKSEGATLPDHLPAVPVDRWWAQKVVRARDDREGWFTLRRKDIILGFANRDGGTHVDPRSRGPHTPSIGNALDLAVTNSLTGRHEPARSVAHLCIRQMAWEVERSLHLQLEQLQGA